jgi:hypothetical protein
VLLGGRTLDIDIALTQDDARAMAAGKNGKAGPKDKRNVYLVRQSLLAPPSLLSYGLLIINLCHLVLQSLKDRLLLSSGGYSHIRHDFSLMTGQGGCNRGGVGHVAGDVQGGPGEEEQGQQRKINQAAQPQLLHLHNSPQPAQFALYHE